MTDERADVVAWLRREAGQLRRKAMRLSTHKRAGEAAINRAAGYNYAANAISRGEHKETNDG